MRNIIFITAFMFGCGDKDTEDTESDSGDVASVG